MNFGRALELLKQGKKVAREGWNGKGMWLFLFSASDFCIKNDDMSVDFPIDDDSTEPIKHIGFDDGKDFYSISDFILIKTAQGTCVPWVTSQMDVLAEDWEVAQ